MIAASGLAFFSLHCYFRTGIFKRGWSPAIHCFSSNQFLMAWSESDQCMPLIRGDCSMDFHQCSLLENGQLNSDRCQHWSDILTAGGSGCQNPIASRGELSIQLCDGEICILNTWNLYMYGQLKPNFRKILPSNVQLLNTQDRICL